MSEPGISGGALNFENESSRQFIGKDQNKPDVPRDRILATQTRVAMTDHLSPDTTSSLLPGDPARPTKSPLFAFLMSLVIPGSGQIYCRHTGRGFLTADSGAR